MFRQFFCHPWFLFKQSLVYTKMLIGQKKTIETKQFMHLQQSFKLT